MSFGLRFLSFFLIASLFLACQAEPSKSKDSKQEKEEKPEPKPQPVAISIPDSVSFSLNDFYGDSPQLDQLVEEVFASLDDKARIGQMIMASAGPLGKPAAEVKQMIRQKKIGGLIMLKGTRTEFEGLMADFDALAQESGMLPLLYSADAEPSLFNSKIKGTPAVKKAKEIHSEEDAKEAARIISGTLKEMGILYNFAPVCDVNYNQTVGSRSFGNDPETVTKLSQAFIETSQEMGVAATAKHFPGHGNVKGDTHKQLVFIDGEMKEVPLYKPLIEAGVISVMVGHIVVKNNEDYDSKGMPASCSRELVTGLLREELGFKGLIITDAISMGALKNIGDRYLLAVKAGCDMILMPALETKAINTIFEEIEKDEAFKAQVYESVKRVLRLKICLGVIK